MGLEEDIQQDHVLTIADMDNKTGRYVTVNYNRCVNTITSTLYAIWLEK